MGVELTRDLFASRSQSSVAMAEIMKLVEGEFG